MVPRARMAEPDSAWVDLEAPLPAPGCTRGVELRGHALLVCNAGGRLYVIADRCPHTRSSLAGGALRGCVLECPLHGGTLDVRDGAPLGLPIRRPATCYPVRPRGDGWQVALPPAVS